MRWYGAGPLHLLTLVSCLALAGYAALRMLPSHPVAVTVWFVGGAIGHDLLLLPLYALADRSVLSVLRHRRTDAPATGVNFVRVPVVLSGILLLVWFPLVLRIPADFDGITGTSVSPYLEHWLLVTGLLFAGSALAFALHLRRRGRTHRGGADASPSDGRRGGDAPR